MAGGSNWKCDDFADIFLTCQDHYQPIKTRRHTGMRRSAVFVGANEVSEPAFSFFFRKTHNLKYFSLHFWIRDSNAAGGELKAIADQVILLGSQGAQVLFFHKFFHVIRMGSRKGVMCKREFFFVLIPFKEWKISNPRESERVRIFVFTSKVKFVCSEFFRCLFMSVSRKRFFPDFFSTGFCHKNHQPLNHIEYIVLSDKRHLQIYLRVFQLSVAAQIFITHCMRDLKISFKTSNHQELFVLLRGLRERVKFARLHS